MRACCKALYSSSGRYSRTSLEKSFVSTNVNTSQYTSETDPSSAPVKTDPIEFGPSVMPRLPIWFRVEGQHVHLE